MQRHQCCLALSPYLGRALKRTAPQVLRARPSGVRWTYWIRPPKGYFSSQPAPTPQPIPISAPWPFEPPPEYVDPPREWKYRKYGPAVGRRLRTPHGWYITVRQFRTVWPKKWRTERKMRYISARLKMHDYGADGLINVARMMETTRRNYRAAWLAKSRACGVPKKQTVWPGDRIPRGCTESSPLAHFTTPTGTPESRRFPTPWYLGKRTIPRLPFQLTFNFWQ